MQDVAIRFDGLSRRFGAVNAVEDLTFTVDAGRVTGLLGPNGAGKSTTLRCLLGLIRPTAGRALLLGKPLAEHAHPPGVVGAVWERGGFHPGRSGRDHLRVLATSEKVAPERVEEVLALVGLEEAAGRRVGGYSLGMRQRLGIAAALLADPAVLVLDEPANGLDPQGVRWLRALLREQAAQGKAVLVSSHGLAEVALTADDVVVVRRGKLVAHAPVAELTSSLADGVEVAGPDAERIATVFEARGHTVERAANERVTVFGATAGDVGRVVGEEGLVIHELRPREATLEDAFVALVS